jgi:hypothetical protein
MIDFLSRLVRLFARADVSVADVVHTIGTIAADPGIPMPIELVPATAGIRRASLARYPDSGAPYLLRFELEPTTAPSLGELAAAFGVYRPGRRDRDRAVPLIFDTPTRPAEWEVAVIAELAPHAVPSDASRVQTVVVQREPVIASSPASNEVKP